MRRLVLTAMLAAALAGAPASLGKRPPSRGEGSSIRRATVAFVHRPESPAARDNRVVSVEISTISRVYALVRLESASAGPAHALLHRSRGGWHVVDFGSGAFPCSDATARVLKDLIGGCVP